MRLNAMEKLIQQLVSASNSSGPVLTNRVQESDLLIPPSSFSDPIEVGDPIPVIPGQIYSMLYFGKWTGFDEGDGYAATIRLHLQGVTVLSSSRGENPGPLPIFGGQGPGDDQTLGEDKIVILTGSEIQLGLSVAKTEVDDLVQGTTTEQLHNFALSFIG